MFDTILKPVLTEKTLMLASRGVFTFSVRLSADKNQIEKAIADMYKVHPIEVRTVRLHGKMRRAGKKAQMVQRSDWKKAMVELKKGETIDAFQLTQSKPETK
jgi:large subunit ribosomal protein L23